MGRTAELSLIGSSFGYQGRDILHSIFVDYESYYDASDLDPASYVNKNGNLGYRLFYNPIDSLLVNAEAGFMIRNEQDRYLAGNYLKSNGIKASASSQYALQFKQIDARLSAAIDVQDLDWEAYQSASANAGLDYSSYSLDWISSFAISQRRDDIYNILSADLRQDSHYQKSDTQKLNTLDLHSMLSYYPAHNIQISLNDNYAERKTALEKNLIRNNDERYNLLQFNVDYAIRDNLQFSGIASHNYTIKDFSYDQNTRELENRSLSTKISWAYAEYDSLMLNLGIDLQQTYFPKNLHKWDNDLRVRSSALGWKHYYRDLIRIGNYVSYYIRDDVYIDSLLSSNNHVIQSISYMPNVDILLGDRLCFTQSYQIRTDYTDYDYDAKNTDKLYRQLGYSYSLIFDSFPYVARAGDDKWFRMPYRQNPGNAFKAVLSFGYEENQYADKEEEHYLLSTKNRRYEASIKLSHDIAEFHYELKPQYMWGTWHEYSMIAGFSWQFNNQSYLELTITPIAEDIDDIDWRSSVNLNLRF